MQYEPSTSLNDYLVLEEVESFLVPETPENIIEHLEDLFVESAKLGYSHNDRVNWIVTQPSVIPYLKRFHYAIWRLSIDNPGTTYPMLAVTLIKYWNNNTLQDAIRL